MCSFHALAISAMRHSHNRSLSYRTIQLSRQLTKGLVLPPLFYLPRIWWLENKAAKSELVMSKIKACTTAAVSKQFQMGVF